MASGSFDFGIASNKLQGRITWSSSSNGAVANTSNVNAILYAKRVDGYTTTGQSWSGYVKIGSSQANISFSSSVSVGSSWVQMASLSNVVVAHNANGTGSVAISGSVTGPSGTSLSGVTSSGNATATLDTIARYFSSTPTITLTSKTETSFTLTWNTSETCSKVVLNVGGSTYSTTNVNAKSGSLTISGRSANTSYNVYGTFTRSDSGLTSNSATAKWQTHQYPYVSAIQTANLQIGSSQKVTITNPLSRSVTIYMKKDSTSGTQLYSGTTSGTSLTFTPTASTLYASIPSAKSGNAVYYCVYSNQIVSSKSGTYSVKGTETPTFSNFTFADTNSTTTALTGDSSIIVKGYSNVQISVPVANKATANNSATMSSYKMQVEGMNAITKDYSSSAVVSTTQNGATSNKISVSAIDSRGLTTTVTKSGTLKDYFKPYVTSLTATRANNGVGKEVTLAYEINFWNQSFGNVGNSVQALTYRYRTTYGSWQTGATTLTYNMSGNKLTGSVSIRGDLGAEGFTLGETFEIELTLTDRLSTITSTATLLSGTPAIAIAGNKVGIGRPVKTSLDVALQVDGNIALFGGELQGTATNATKWNNTEYDITTLNTTDTWVPVVNGNKLQHRVINAALNNKGVKTLTGADGVGWSNQTDGDSYLISKAFMAWWNGSWQSGSNHGSNLTYAHQGIIQCKPTSLYDNSSGSNGTITLSETSANFTYLDVMCRTDDGYRFSTMVYSPNGKNVGLIGIQANSSDKYEWVKTRIVAISGTSISTISNRYANVKIGTGASSDGTNVIYIVKVIGWK